MNLLQLWQDFVTSLTANSSAIQTLAALLAIVGVGVALVGVILRRLHPSSIPVAPHEAMEFHTLWRKLSPILNADLKASIAYATESRILATESSGQVTDLLNIQPPKIALESGSHWKTISRYDSQLAKQLKEYLVVLQDLRSRASEYNRLVKNDKTESGEFQDAKSKLYNSSRRLEQASDMLVAMVNHYDAVIPKDS